MQEEKQRIIPEQLNIFNFILYSNAWLSELLDIWTLSTIQYAKKQKEHNVKKLDLYLSSGERWEASTLSSLLEKANLNHCRIETYYLSKTLC
jgi:aspartokinase